MTIKISKKKPEFAMIGFIILVLIIITFPFLNRALAIDDIYIASIANQLVQEPLDPYGFDMYIQNRKLGSAFDYTNPPLVSYYYALIQYFFGKNEFIIHSFFMAFTITAAVSMFYLSKKFTIWYIAAVFLLITTPIFAVTSHNFMHDLPVLAFFLLSILTFVKGVDNDKKSLLILSGLLISLAFLTKYNAIILFPLLIVYALMKKKAKYSLFLFIPLLLILAWSVFEWYQYGKVHSINFFFNWHTTDIFSSSILAIIFNLIIPYAIANLSYIGGATVLFIFLVHPFIKQRKDIVLLLSLILINSLFAIFLFFKSAEFISGQYSIFQLSLLVLFMTSSSFFIVKMIQFISLSIYDLIKKRKYEKNSVDKIFLGCWFFLGLIFHTFIAGGNARYLIIILPPSILLFLMIIEEHAKIYKIKTRSISFMLIAAVALNVLVSLTVSIADYQYAEVYRDFAQKMPYQYAESRIFFTGHEGFKYYMEKKGYIFYDPYTQELKNGDIIIVPKIPVPRNLDHLKDNLILLDKIEYNTYFPFRTNNPQSHAGFYVYVNGLLPYSFSKLPLEVFEIYKFKKN